MKFKSAIWAALVALVMFLALAAAAKTDSGKDKDKEVSTPSATTIHARLDENTRLAGEKRFHSNCGRCHSAPPKFSPRMTATIVRHMRVRATITDQDMRLVLAYMAE